ncbi:phospholipase [Heyndrickxia sporothermodurans]|uniref:phospholipase D family protein n=1 Tax=Heyndrickxia TaxID=2837504 RepID=UPI000D35DD23|nr:phospholipase D family protein [Heyndrickxia sporothermodurans]PTY80748.1 phospholipase [Heyndrickxia sporothermodurans]
MTKKKVLFFLLFLFFLVYVSTILYHVYKPLPKGISYEGQIHHVSEDDISFLTDLTYQKEGHLQIEQEIFPRIFEVIEQAQQFIVCDFFLFNSYYDHDLNFPPLSESMAQRLIRKKREKPNMRIIVITDDINTYYGSHKSKELEEMKRNGIEVVMTNLDPLRDSTPLYSAVWRMFIRPFGQSGKGWIPNAMADTAPHMTIRSYLELLNIKANHRKTFATEKSAFILSGNPHDASAYFSNHAIEIKGPIIQDLLLSEQAAVELSNGPKLPTYSSKDGKKGEYEVQLLTEGKVFEHILKAINQTNPGDELWMGMFYIADRKIIHSLLKAADRGVNIKLILDPNENAFGNKKSGLPNRPVARELNKKSKGKIHIRWYNTGKEQYHAKLIYIKKRKHAQIFSGSTNLTLRNLADYNLETDVKITAPIEAKLVGKVDRYFQRIWTNRDAKYTLELSKFQGKLIFLQNGVYRLQKLLHLTTY